MSILEKIAVGNWKSCARMQFVIFFLGVYFTLCTTINPCADSPCMHDGVCSLYNATSYMCRCKINYTGVNCEIKPKTPCNPDPCMNGANCTITNQTFTCSCVSGYEGTTCENKAETPCNPDPCMNGATCTITNQTFTCSCVSRYEGSKCENKVNKGEKLYSSMFNLFIGTACYFVWSSIRF